ncbi:hypothetical protein [Nonomuraea sp. NPDC001831]|uniref:hypothetical protein n=1 Tax=Nonomuraea sp. NPDC001831 TaxID=3364340 RepID=UPI0036BE998B
MRHAPDQADRIRARERVVLDAPGPEPEPPPPGAEPAPWLARLLDFSGQAFDGDRTWPALWPRDAAR